MAAAVLAGPVLGGVEGRVPAVANAQSNQPIYPAYDGFLKNPDGSYTLSFAYFSHNAEPVTIPAGPGNSFAPDPADRQHPTTFRPGHWRFQCIIVVGPEFDGKLRWTLTYAGTSTGTSQNMLHSNYNLVEGAAELKAIDYARVPRGVCLNRAPIVRVLGLSGRGRGAPPAMSVAVNQELNLFGSVADEGLPRGGKLTVAWQKLSGPGTVTFTPTQGPRTRATFSAPGTYELELTANDTELTGGTRINVTVR
jgi:PKD domain-containing protein